ncbi:MAG: hypothetical protein Ct9H300mP26_4720 [Acidimicrobiales bacterium]|nr:MAG: hypothetical protein Ct9H300mP26_4720 [Acidimicrobiales bacterium]
METMAAILGLDDDLVVSACARVDGDVWVANYNAPGQIVIAGSPTAVGDASDKAKELGAKKSYGTARGRGVSYTIYGTSKRSLT